MSGPELSANAMRVLEARYLLRDRERRLIETPGELFQRVELPAGRSEVRFAYAPPGIGWAWLSAALALAALLLPYRRR